MAKDIDRRLQSLKSRRKGTDRLNRLTRDAAAEVIGKSIFEDSYARRAAPTQKYTKYALGAMQAVDADYTRISLEEAARVGNQLRDGFARKAINVEFRLQGSVACDIHIRGVSDVDLLVIDGRYFRYAYGGLRELRGDIPAPPTFDVFAALIQLRKDAEGILVDAFPAATVDRSGAKAINLSGGSLRRPVDVVPSNWYDTVDYQRTLSETDRGVEILNKVIPERVLNLPFKHIDKISTRDTQCLGGLKKAIRLCKNVKADAAEDGTSIELSSYDIAAALWHADLGALTVGAERELAVLGETTRFLDVLYRNQAYAESLVVPDGSRRIFDTADKRVALLSLSLEMDDLATRVAREQARMEEYAQITAGQITEALRNSYVPSM